MESNPQVNIRHFNQYQNLVAVSDANGNGKLDASDTAIAQRNFTLDVLEDPSKPNGPRREIHFKAGDAVPFQRYQFLLKHYKAGAAEAWAATPMAKRLDIIREPRLLISPSAQEVLKRNGMRLETAENGTSKILHRDGKNAWDLHATAESESGTLMTTQKAIISADPKDANTLKITTLEDDGSTHIYFLDARRNQLQENPAPAKRGGIIETDPDLNPLQPPGLTLERKASPASSPMTLGCKKMRP